MTIESNAEGDAALAFRFPEETLSAPSLVSLRPAGGLFGAPVPLTPRNASAADVAVGPDGAAVAAWTEKRGGVRASFREPGGDWGAPVTLAGGADVARAAIDAQGAALVVWSQPDGRMQSALRPPGGPFAPAADVPGSGVVRALEMDAAGNALALSAVLSPSGSKSVIHSSYRPAGGAFEAPRRLATVTRGRSEAGLAMTATGDAVAAFTGADGITAARRPAGGDFGPAAAVSSDPADGGSTVTDVALAADGTAAVSWKWAPGGFYGDSTRTVRAALAPAGGPFERPIRLSTLRQPASDARVAVDERGDIAVVWGDPRFSVHARYRPAGGAFGARTQLAGPRLGGLPDVAIDSEGRATAAWQQNDGERTELVAQDFSADGAGPPAQVVTTAPSYTPLHNSRARCHPPGTRTLLESREARVYQGSRGTIGCFFRRGKPFRLEFGFGDDQVVSRPPAMTLAGPLLAFVLDDDVCATCGGHTELTVIDLRTGRTANGFGPSDGPDPGVDYHGRIRRMVLRRDAALAWVQRKGKTSRVYKMGAGAVGPTRLAKGKGIDARSLRLSGDRVQWRQGGRLRSAPL